jgi:hypothetical protein
MKRILFALSFSLVMLVPLTASASDAALGVSASSYSLQVQGDYDFDRRFGLQAGVGEMLFLNDLSLSAGARFYFVPRKVSPYIGGLYRTFERHGHDHAFGDDHEYYRESLVGPTIGLRAREWRGIGAFGQVELLQHVGDDDHHWDEDGDRGHDGWHTSLALGVQWWF